MQKSSSEVALKKALVNYESEMLALGDSAYYKEKWSRVKENVQLNTGVLATRVTLKQAELAYEQTIIRAPFSGALEGIRLRTGDFISAGTELGSIYDPSNYEVEVPILEYDLLKIKEGMRVTVFPLANDAEIGGMVSVINPAVDSKGQSLVKVRLRNPNDVLPGLSVRVEINVTDEPSIVIPMQAVVNRSDRHVVFNVENDLAKWNYVTLGKNNGEKVQVLEGLKEGMEVIVSNNLQLAHDSPVRTN